MSSNYLWGIRDKSLDISKQRIIKNFFLSLTFHVSIKQKITNYYILIPKQKKNDKFYKIELNKKIQLII